MMLSKSEKWLSLLVALFFGLASCSGGDPAGPDENGSKWPPPDPVTIDPSPFPAMPLPGDNPLTRQGIELGRRLFYDPILSADSTQSCSSCHRFGFAFSEPQRFSVGIDGIEGNRNAPQLTNAGWLTSAFWDGRRPSLEGQAVEPVINKIEMHETWPHVVEKIQNHPDYPDLFGRAFGTDVVSRDLVVKAIAQFERTFVSKNSAFDRFIRGEAPLSAEASRGFQLFTTERGDCFHCHPADLNSLLFTDHSFRNIGLDPELNDQNDDRFLVTGNPSDWGKFKVPTLRNVEMTAPYMHDGRFSTLEEVVGHYNSGGFQTSTTDPLLRPRGVGLGLTPEELSDIVAFLKTLTDTTFLNNPDLSDPFEQP